ncbi:MAG: DOMON-like domain-containing protein [Candidatus Krumholzibacteriia bacterium]
MNLIPPTGDGDRFVPLLPHPAAPCAEAIRISARAARAGDGRLALAFTLAGPLAGLRLPPPGPPTRGAGLWRHTCFEAFIARDDDDATAYHEVNLTPGRLWDLHAFRSCRDGGPLAGEPPAPRIDARRDDGRLELTATLDLGALDPRLRDAPLRLGLAAVIEDARGALSWWALRHPAARPDFHDPAGFTLRLPLAPGAPPPYPLHP